MSRRVWPSATRRLTVSSRFATGSPRTSLPFRSTIVMLPDSRVLTFMTLTSSCCWPLFYGSRRPAAPGFRRRLARPGVLLERREPLLRQGVGGLQHVGVGLRWRDPRVVREGGLPYAVLLGDAAEHVPVFGSRLLAAVHLHLL